MKQQGKIIRLREIGQTDHFRGGACVLFSRQKVHEQRSEVRVPQDPRHEVVPWAVPAASATVSEENDACCRLGHNQRALQQEGIDGNRDRIWISLGHVRLRFLDR